MRLAQDGVQAHRPERQRPLAHMELALQAPPVPRLTVVFLAGTGFEVCFTGGVFTDVLVFVLVLTDALVFVGVCGWVTGGLATVVVSAGVSATGVVGTVTAGSALHAPL